MKGVAKPKAGLMIWPQRSNALVAKKPGDEHQTERMKTQGGQGTGSLGLAGSRIHDGITFLRLSLLLADTWL